MKLKFVSELIQIASLRFIEALEGSKITTLFSVECWLLVNISHILKTWLVVHDQSVSIMH